MSLTDVINMPALLLLSVVLVVRRVGCKLYECPRVLWTMLQIYM